MDNAAQVNGLVNLCKAVYDKGMVCGSGGNLSFRAGGHIYITPSGYSLGRMKPEDIVKVTMEGEALGPIKPSKELALHLAAYRARPDAGAVLHVHSYYTVLTGILAGEGAEPMPPYTPGYVMKIGNTVLAPFFIPGSIELAQSIEKGLLKTDVVLMKNHGVTIVGKGLTNLLDKAEEVENNARLHIALRGTGALGSEAIAEIKERYR